MSHLQSGNNEATQAGRGNRERDKKLEGASAISLQGPYIIRLASVKVRQKSTTTIIGSNMKLSVIAYSPNRAV